MIRKRRSAVVFTMIMLISSYSTIELGSWEALASTDDDGDGLTYGLEFYINTQPQDWDSDNDGLPDGWEWQYGLNPLSAIGENGSVGDPDGDAFTNLNEYLYAIPAGWDNPLTPNELDNGVWWNGTVPVREWDEESAMQLLQGSGTDGFDEDPVGNICFNGFDDDKDGLVDNFDSDGDGDADCSSDDDDGDGEIDEDPDGWDTDGDGMPDGWEVANNLDPTSASNLDGSNGDPDGDGLVNLKEYVNPTWGTRNGTTTPPTQYFRPGPNAMTATESPCNPILLLGPGGCLIFTAEVDGITQTDPNNNDTDGDGLNDSHEALLLLTDPTAVDTDGDGIHDGVEVNGSYGDPPQATDPRNNNTDGDQFDDGEEDVNGNGVVDGNETDPTRIEDVGDIDDDGIENWEENMTCTKWNVTDTDGGGVSDGDEHSISHHTDPCVSEIEIVKTIISWDSVEQSLELNDTFDLDTTPMDWRQQGSVMAYYVLANASRVGFRYESVFNQFLRNVDTDMPSSAVSVVFTNNSWCWNATAGAINSPHCDDDYLDTDSDGLADWEEWLGTWGYFSMANLSDSDGDGVDDLTEIQNQTDPMEPCHNLLDSDGDGLNNYFENTTGCDLAFGIVGGNGTIDTYFTLWNEIDTDNGGVADGQEYLDGTNPQNNSEDDLNPLDTDGDGIPDTIEQAIGTDWLNPDTDGGGIPDGIECPEEFWEVNCLNSPTNPWDASDDLDDNMLYFLATNTSSSIDTNINQYWRWHTYDTYTGVSFGVNSSLVGNTIIVPSFSSTQGVAATTYWDDSEVKAWTIEYQNGAEIQPGDELILPYNAVNWTSWVDQSAGLNFSNYTRDVIVDESTIDTIFITAPQVSFVAEIQENTTEFLGSNYAMDLPASYLDRQSAVTVSVTQTVLNDSGAFSAWEKVVAIQNFLINGNNTTAFTRNYDGVQPNLWHDYESDLTYYILNNTQEGSCDQFATLFAVMLRHAGLSSRKVTGFSGGTWNGKAFEVYGSDFTTWVEVHLQTNANQGNETIGWVPFEACPPQALVEVVNEEWGPTNFDRDLNGSEIWLNGTLQFVENGTFAENVTIDLYLVKGNETALVPGPAATSNHFIASGMTDLNGSFNLNGTPLESVNPGYGALVLHVYQKAYVGVQGISFVWRMNVTDDSVLSISSPPPITEPMLGVGVNTTFTGEMNWENSPFSDPSLVDNMQVLLNYTSSIDGPQNLIADIGPSGYYEFSVPIDDAEPLGLISASLAFLGWHEDDLNNASTPEYHVRPSTFSFLFNITPSPNLTIVLEAQGINNTFLDIGSPIYINGSSMSRGISPESLNGTLYFQMRRANTNGPYVTLAAWYLNDSNWTTTPGDFELSWAFLGSDVPISAGLVEVKFQFDAEGLFANDEVTYLTEHGIRSGVNFNYTLGLQSRGNMANVEVILTDHTDTSVADFLGTYLLDFDGENVWNETDPSVPRIATEWLVPADMEAGDYSWILNYSGSIWFNPASIVDVVRIQGRANATVNLGSDWTPRGTTNWVSGHANELALNTVITGNNSSVTVQLEVPSDLPPLPDGSPAPPVIHRLGSTWINITTGEYNQTFSMPEGVGSGVYVLRVFLDFTVNAPVGGHYYSVSDADKVNAGIQTEYIVESAPNSLIVVAGQVMIINATITDVESESPIPDASANLYFDFGGPLQQLLESDLSGTDGVVRFSPTIPADTPPGYYTVRVHAPDDITDNLTVPNAGRWLGNESTSNLTVQVASYVDINPLAPEVTAGSTFIVSGQVMDAIDANRTVDGPMAVEVFFLDDPSETLISTHTTSNNGSFNITVPTDPFGDGVTSGVKTVVVSVLNGSTPFYLTGTGNDTILVRGVTAFRDKIPFLNMVVDRGDTIVFSAKLVESSDSDRNLAGMNISAIFHDTWMSESVTNVEGDINFSFNIPHDHPLGLVSVILYYNGSNTLHNTLTLISTITVRSQTFITVDPILDNPAAGDSFNVSGNLTSSNGSAIMDRAGNTLAPSLTFMVDGESNTFQIISSSVDLNGSWLAIIRLDLTFSRGSHNIEATFTPTVNYYGLSVGNGTFDSRGYSLITILNPLDLDPDERTVRGNNLSMNLSLIDNAGGVVPAAQIDIYVDELFTTSVFSDSLGLANTMILIDEYRAAGPMEIRAVFTGFNGTTGLVGDEAITRVVILAPSVLEITAFSGSAIAGESITFHGTLLDEHGNALLENGQVHGGIIHLSIDGVDVGPIYSTLSNSTTGVWSIIYNLPLDSDYGDHRVRVDFLGGFTWIDPMGQGDSLNPEYYLPSTFDMEFNATQTSQVVLTTPPGEIDRNQLLLIEGMLTDGSGRVLPNRYVNVYMNDQLLTGLNIDVNGSFSLYIPVPPDMELGPRIVKIEFEGEEFILASNSTSIFIVFSPAVVSVFSPEPSAVGDNLRLSGTIRDNMPNGLLANHSLEIFIDGTLIGITTSDENGYWVLNWVVSEFIDVGVHTVTVKAPQQGYYREGLTETNLTIAYHSGITLQVDSSVVTRGGVWNFSGRLFDDDSSGRPGLEAREFSVILDGEKIETITTSIDGTFSFNHELGYSIARGGHDISVVFNGETFYLPISYNMTVFVKADITLEVLWVADTIIRSDVEHPIKIEGRILEIGGDGNILEDLVVTLHWSSTSAEPATITWDEATGHFRIISPAHYPMAPGEIDMWVEVEADSSRYLNFGKIDFSVGIMVPVNFLFTPDSQYVGKDTRIIRGTVNITATDTLMPVANISISALLINSTSGLSLLPKVTMLTDEDGIVAYEFKAVEPLPSLWDQTFWGPLKIMFSTDSMFVDPSNRTWLSTQHGGLEIEYEPAEKASLIKPILFGLLVAFILVGLIGGGMMYRRRQQATLDDLASVFSYTAELLAAGDAFREAIFNCYESLCQILMRRGFLRRDFETVREFETAIRSALPISEQSLIALDRIFEEARYSSHILGEGHRQNAQISLNAVLQEIDQLQEVPVRDDIIQIDPEQ